MTIYNDICIRFPVDSILDAVLTVSPNRQYRGIVRPITPVRHLTRLSLRHPVTIYQEHLVTKSIS